MFGIISYRSPAIVGILATAIALATVARANRDDVLTPFAPTPVAHAAVIGSAAQVRPVTPMAQEFPRAADGLFYVDIAVNGKPLRFLVDTGASVVVLTAADARTLGIEPSEHHYNQNVETVGGNTAMAWTTLNHVRVAGREIRQLRAAVVRNGLGVSLLGQNMLSKLGSVTIEGDRIRLE